MPLTDPPRPTDPPSPAAIEVGAAEGELRYWLAKEAVRQGEARLNAQNGIRTALEARASAITGWAAVGFLATIGTGFSAAEAPRFFGAAMAGALLFAAGTLAITAARPKDWSIVGYDPDLVLSMSTGVGTELEALESIAGGLADGVKVNNGRIGRTAKALRQAGWLLILAPLLGGITYGLVAMACDYPWMAAWMAWLGACPSRL